MSDSEFWTIFAMLVIAIGTNLVTYLSARMANQADQKKIDAVRDSVNFVKASLDSLGGRYLKLEKESRDAELLLKFADLVQRDKEASKEKQTGFG